MSKYNPDRPKPPRKIIPRVLAIIAGRRPAGGRREPKKVGTRSTTP